MVEQRQQVLTASAMAQRVQGRLSRAGRVRLEIVEFDPPRALTFRARARIVRFDDEIRLLEDNGATRLSATMRARPAGWMRPFERPMARTMKRQFAANWEALRRPLETSAAPQR